MTVTGTFVSERTTGFDAARRHALAADWEVLERESGAGRDRMHATPWSEPNDLDRVQHVVIRRGRDW